MGIIDSFLIKSARNGNTRSVRLALSLYSIKNIFEKFFSKINPFRSKESFNVRGDRTLNQALECSIKNLDHNVMTLLIDAGADVNEIEKNSIGNVVLQYKIASEAIPYGDKEDLRNRREKCCLVLGELIINGAIPQNAEERKEMSEIFKQTKGFDELKAVVERKLKPQKPPRTYKRNSISAEPSLMELINAEVNNNVALPKNSPRTFEHDDVLLLKEPIYAEVYDAKVINSLEESNISEESIYAEIYDSHKRSTENLSLEDSGYSSISEEPIYEDIDNFSEQKKPANLNYKEQPEPIYAKVDLSKKRAERKAKEIKANSGTYHGLVQDKVNEWQEQMELSERDSDRFATDS